MKTILRETAVAPVSNYFRNPTAFSPKPDETDFRPFASERFDRLVALKERVASNLEQEFADTIGSRFIRQVVNEAAALAATTSFPALLLPALAEEKARKASQWAARQRAIRNQAFTLAA